MILQKLLHSLKRILARKPTKDTSGPDLVMQMDWIRQRSSLLYWAGTMGNWELATYYMRSLIKALKRVETSRPKYAASMKTFRKDAVAPLQGAIASKNQADFIEAWKAYVMATNHWHGHHNVAHFRYRTPVVEPVDLDLRPADLIDPVN